MTRARLFSKWGSTRDLEFEIADEATIGRSAGNTIRLDDRAVSSHHARLEFDPERDAYYLEDLDSLNGTRVDGVAAHGRERLERLHLLDFGGSSSFLFVRLETASESVPADAGPKTEAATPTPEKTSVDREIPVLPDALAAPSTATDTGKTSVEELAVMLPEGVVEPAGGGVTLRFVEGREIELTEGEMVVGRAPDAAVRIDALEISRRHAVVRRDGERIYLRDLGGRNRTFVEGLPLEPDKEVEITPPAKLRFGTIEVELVARTERDG